MKAAMGIKEAAVGEAINLGSGKEHRVIDMANRVNELVSNEAGIKYVERRDLDVKTNFSFKKKPLLRKQKEEKNAAQASQMEFEDGLKKVHEWFVDNWEGVEKSAEF